MIVFGYFSSTLFRLKRDTYAFIPLNPHQKEKHTSGLWPILDGKNLKPILFGDSTYIGKYPGGWVEQQVINVKLLGEYNNEL